MLSYDAITICLNAAPTIGDTLRSVLSQTPPPRQYLIVDGGSTDGTQAQIAAARQALASTATAVHVEAQEPCAPRAAGIPSAWNQALRRVTADVVFIINADDWYEPAAAPTVLHAFAENPAADIVTTGILYRATPGGPVLRQQSPRSLRWLPVLMPVPHPGCFVRRTVYDRLGRFDERYAVSADYDFVYRAARQRCVFLSLPQPLVSMRPGGFARQRLGRARRETFLVAHRHGAGWLRPGVALVVRWLLQR
jgi:glycosyltransferase involved in cell wall biosynthesis